MKHEQLKNLYMKKAVHLGMVKAVTSAHRTLFEDLWIEIKGFFRGKGKEKWDEFHTKIQTNSELWDKQKLKEMRIL